MVKLKCYLRLNEEENINSNNIYSQVAWTTL